MARSAKRWHPVAPVPVCRSRSPVGASTIGVRMPNHPLAMEIIATPAARSPAPAPTAPARRRRATPGQSRSHSAPISISPRWRRHTGGVPSTSLPFAATSRRVAGGCDRGGDRSSKSGTSSRDDDRSHRPRSAVTHPSIRFRMRCPGRTRGRPWRRNRHTPRRERLRAPSKSARAETRTSGIEVQRRLSARGPTMQITRPPAYGRASSSASPWRRRALLAIIASGWERHRHSAHRIDHRHLLGSRRALVVVTGAVAQYVE